MSYGSTRVAINSEGFANAGKITDAVYTSDSDATRILPSDSGVAMTNPVWETYGQSKYTDERNHAYQYINKYKVVEIALVNASRKFPPDLTSNEWGNWRETNAGATQPIKVDKSVLLLKQGQGEGGDQKFKFRYTNEYGDKIFDTFSGGFAQNLKGGFELLRNIADKFKDKKVDAASEAGEDDGSSMSTGGKFMSLYHKTPSWEGITPLSFEDTMAFDFNFGQAGIFSAEHEVVRPILALALIFLPYSPEGDNYFLGPLPTAPHFYSNYLLTFGQQEDTTEKREDFGRSFLQETKRAEAFMLAKQVTAVEKSLEGPLHKGNTKSSDGFSTAICFKIGRMTIGPFIASTIDWTFDYKQVDEFGFPYKGSITFGGLKSNIIPTEKFVGSFFQGLDFTDKLNDPGNSEVGRDPSLSPDEILMNMNNNSGHDARLMSMS